MHASDALDQSPSMVIIDEALWHLAQANYDLGRSFGTWCRRLVTGSPTGDPKDHGEWQEFWSALNWARWWLSDGSAMVERVRERRGH